MVHLDLFSGIGGFAYAVDEVWDGVEHIFCDNEPFARKVLNKHWPEAYIYDDIKEINTDTLHERLEGFQQRQAKGQPRLTGGAGKDQEPRPFILTGGFPCQPFSAAGVRRGTDDERYLWPEMLRVIRLTQPQWVIAENVGGLLTWEEGLVFEQVCTDLEDAGYEVQAFVIPAVAVNAPHRRDRIWFVAHSKSHADSRRPEEVSGKNGRSQLNNLPELSDSDRVPHPPTDSIDSRPRREERGSPTEQNRVSEINRTQHSTSRELERTDSNRRFNTSDWDENWAKVAAEFCGVDDGLPKGLDRANQIKAYGNAIVPQVAIEILKGIKGTNHELNI